MAAIDDHYHRHHHEQENKPYAVFNSFRYTSAAAKQSGVNHQANEKKSRRKSNQNESIGQ